jgi:hypothetical protein
MLFRSLVPEIERDKFFKERLDSGISCANAVDYTHTHWCHIAPHFAHTRRELQSIAVAAGKKNQFQRADCSWSGGRRLIEIEKSSALQSNLFKHHFMHHNALTN